MRGKRGTRTERHPLRQWTLNISALTAIIIATPAIADDDPEASPTVQSLTEETLKTIIEAETIESLVITRKAELMRLTLTAETLEKQYAALSDLPGTTGEADTPAPPDASSSPEQRVEDIAELGKQRIVIIDNSEGHDGIGFLVRHEGAPRIFSAAHWLGIAPMFQVTDLSEKRCYTSLQLECSANLELVSIAPRDTTLPCFDLVASGDDPKVGDPIVVLSLDIDYELVTHTTGKIRGIGPDVWEIDAKVDDVLIGSPVISLTSGRVIGIIMPNVAGVGSDWATGTRHAKDRSFAARLDRIGEMEASDIHRYAREAQYISRIEEQNHLYWLAYKAMSGSPHLGKTIEKEIEGNDPRGTLKRVLRWIGSGTNTRKRDRPSIMAALANDLGRGRNLSSQFKTTQLAKRYKTAMEIREQGVEAMRFEARQIDR